jgi:hypothetical protein
MRCWQGRRFPVASVVLLSGALLSGCASRTLEISTEHLAAAQKGVVVAFSDAPTVCAHPPNLVLGRFDPESNGWVPAGIVYHASIDRANADDPLIAKELPAGEYGIAQMGCARLGLGGLEGSGVMFGERWAPRSRGGRSVIVRPLAIFTVRGGEVVNIGAIVASESSPETFSHPGTFAHKIGPIPPESLAQFAATMPTLAGRMVTRLMTIPAAPSPVSLNASASAPSGAR